MAVAGLMAHQSWLAFSRADLPPRLFVGEEAPAYVGVTLTGDSVRFADFRGTHLLVNVWATWCGPCRLEMPLLEQLHQELGPDQLRVVGISIDAGSSQAVADHLEENGLTYLNLHDNRDRLMRRFGWGAGVPQTLLLDPNGVIKLYKQGAPATDEQKARFLRMVREAISS